MNAQLQHVSDIGFALGEFAETLKDISPDGLSLMGDFVHHAACARDAEQLARVMRETLAAFEGGNLADEPAEQTVSTPPATEADADLPGWMMDTPDVSYVLVMYGLEGAGHEEIQLEREEYIALKQLLGAMRGYRKPEQLTEVG